MKKFWRLLSLVLILVLAFSMMIPGAEAAKKSKSRTQYAILIDRSCNLMSVFSKKGNSDWKIIGVQVCSTGNPYWSTRKGEFVVTGKKKSLKIDDTNYKYVTFYGCLGMIHAKPKIKKQDFPPEFGTSCTMGSVWLTQKWAKWIFNKIPVGTKVYVF